MRKEKKLPQKKLNHNILAISFVATLSVMGILHFLLPGHDISLEEGRRLNRFPALSYDDAVSGRQAENIENWYSDQFPFRESLIKMGKQMQRIAFPNLNAGGLELVFISHDMVPEDETPGAEVDVPEQTDNLQPGGIDNSQGSEDTPPAKTDPAAANPDDTVSQPTEIDPETDPAATEGKPVIPDVPLGEVEEVSKVGVIIMGNRAMENYYGKEEKLKAYAGRLNEMAAGWASELNFYSMVVPTAIELYAPEQYHSGYSSQQTCIGIIQSELSSKIKSVKALEKLLEHRDKYIYFRTDHHWTGLGAYYGYVAFCEASGWTPVPLDSMEHYDIEGTFLGALYRTTKHPILESNPDTTEGWRPIVEYTATAWDKGDLASSYKVKLNNTKSKGGNSYLNFSGGDRALLKITTSNQSGRKILVVKDSFGNALVPYLVNHYDEIYVVDPRYYVNSLKKLTRENKITDLLVANYMFGTSNKSWLKGFDAIR